MCSCLHIFPGTAAHFAAVANPPCAHKQYGADNNILVWHSSISSFRISHFHTMHHHNIKNKFSINTFLQLSTSIHRHSGIPWIFTKTFLTVKFSSADEGTIQVSFESDTLSNIYLQFVSKRRFGRRKSLML